MDVLSPEQRKKNMQGIHSKDTSIEIILRKALWAQGIRYRKNYKKLPGTPDIAIIKYRIVVFCDSEFFHGKDLEELIARLSKSETGDYWIKKIMRNRARDQEIDKQLRILGWMAIHFWGDDIKKNTEGCVQVIKEAIFDRKAEQFNLGFDDTEQ